MFGSGSDQSTRGALLDMLLLGMTNETGAAALSMAGSSCCRAGSAAHVGCDRRSCTAAASSSCEHAGCQCSTLLHRDSYVGQSRAPYLIRVLCWF